eukprot:CFRG0544T1
MPDVSLSTSIHSVTLSELVGTLAAETVQCSRLRTGFLRIRQALTHSTDGGTVAVKHWPCAPIQLLLCVLRGVPGAAEDTRMPSEIALPLWGWASLDALKMMVECIQLLIVITVIDDVNQAARNFGTIGALTRLNTRMVRLMEKGLATNGNEGVELAGEVIEWTTILLGRLSSCVASRGVVTQTFHTIHRPMCGVCSYPSLEVTEDKNGEWDIDLRLREGKFTQAGLGYEIWPGAHVFASWLLLGSLGPAVRGEHVLELGAGCGLAGVLTGLFVASVTMTDGEPALIETLDSNREEARIGTYMAHTLLPAMVLRWGDDKHDLCIPQPSPATLRQNVNSSVCQKKCEYREQNGVSNGAMPLNHPVSFGSKGADSLGQFRVIVAADIIYHSGNIATALISDVIPRYLQLGGYFYLVLPPDRDGTKDFLDAAEEASLRGTIVVTVERAPPYFIRQQHRSKLDSGVGFRLLTIQRLK